MEKGQKVELNSWEAGGLDLPVPPPHPLPQIMYGICIAFTNFCVGFHLVLSLVTKPVTGVLRCRKKERKKATCEQYAKAFDSEEVLYPYHYVDKNWPAEKYSGGCYVSIMPCGVMTNFWKALREPVGRVHFAGTETATVWSGKRCSTNHPTELRSYSSFCHENSYIQSADHTKFILKKRSKIICDKY